MASPIDVQVAASLDDAGSRPGGVWFGPVVTTPYIVYTGGDYWGYARWAGVTIPQGATIVTAKLTLRSDGNFAAVDSATIVGLDEDNVGNFPDWTTAEGYAETDASEVWNFGGWATGEWYDSPELKDIIQEIVDRPGWAGSYLGLKTKASAGSANKAYRSWDYTGNVSGPKLYIEYTVGPTNYDRSASVLVGNLASASRALAIDRDSAILVGNLVSAFKSWGVPKASFVLVGNLTSASRIRGAVRTSSVLIGNLVSASRSWNVPVVSSVLIGNLVSASRIRGAVRTASVLIGNLVSASRSLVTTRIASVIIGNLVSATRTWNRLNIGALAIDRASSTAGGSTLIAKENPANFNGTLTQVEIYADEDMHVVKVGTFYGTPPNFACRGYEAIGDVDSGWTEHAGLSIDAHEGDYVGIFFT